MFFGQKIKPFNVLCSYFFKLQSLYVLILPCSCRKKRVYSFLHLNTVPNANADPKIQIFGNLGGGEGYDEAVGKGQVVTRAGRARIKLINYRFVVYYTFDLTYLQQGN